MKVSVVGQGYVGLPLAMAIAEVGYQVVGIDLNSDLVSDLNLGHSPIGDVLDSKIKGFVDSGVYKASLDFEELCDSEVVIMCVPTPLNIEHKPDLSFLLSATSSVSKVLQNGTLVINESTVAPGTTRGLIKETLDTSGVSYDLAYSPERIDPANKKWKVKNTPKLVAGITAQATDRAATFYRNFVDKVIIGSTPEVIETAKLLENSFRLVNISFINEIAQFCSALNIDVREVIDAAATKPYGFMPFFPSIGIGGHCIPVDPAYLAEKAREIGTTTQFIDLASQFNRSLPAYFAGVASGMLGGLKNKKILVVGVAYKPDVSDVRETPAAELIRELRLKGADVNWHDEIVKEWNGEKSVPLGSKFDLVILANPHSDFNSQALGSAKVLNTRGGY